MPQTRTGASPSDAQPEPSIGVSSKPHIAFPIADERSTRMYPSSPKPKPHEFLTSQKLEPVAPSMP